MPELIGTAAGAGSLYFWTGRSRGVVTGRDTVDYLGNTPIRQPQAHKKTPGLSRPRVFLEPSTL